MFKYGQKSGPRTKDELLMSCFFKHDTASSAYLWRSNFKVTFTNLHCDNVKTGLGGFPPGVFPPGAFPPDSPPPDSSPPVKFPLVISHPCHYPPGPSHPPPPVSTKSFSPALFPRPSSHPVFMLNPRDRKKQNGVLECHALLKNEIHRC